MLLVRGAVEFHVLRRGKQSECSRVGRDSKAGRESRAGEGGRPIDRGDRGEDFAGVGGVGGGRGIGVEGAVQGLPAPPSYCCTSVDMHGRFGT